MTSKFTDMSDAEVLEALRSAMATCPSCGSGWHTDCGKPPADDAAAEANSTEKPAEPFSRRKKLTRASEIAIKPVSWAWETDGQGRIPLGALAVAAGREGTGKSSFGIWMTAGITQGTLPGRFLGSAHDVIYVAVEDSWEYTIAGRLLAAGADLDRVWRLDVEISEDEVSTINLPHDFDLLEEAIKENSVKLVVLDPLISTIGATVDTHKERSVRTVLDPLARMADRTGAVFLGIAHFGKGAGNDPSTLITGSGAFKNVPRAIFGFAVDQEADERVVTQTKNSLGRLDLPSLGYKIEPAKILTSDGEHTEVGRFDFTGESARSVQDILSAGGSGDDERSEKADAVDFLLSELDGAWKRTKDVEEIAKEKHGISLRTLARARKSAGVQARQFPTGLNGKNEWFLALPEQAATLADPEKQKEGQAATNPPSNRADSQTANPGSRGSQWQPGSLPLPEGVGETQPETVAARPPEATVKRICAHGPCGEPLPADAKPNAQYCSRYHKEQARLGRRGYSKKIAEVAR